MGENAEDGAIRNLRERPQAEVLHVFELANGLRKSKRNLMLCVNSIPQRAVLKYFWRIPNSFTMVIVALLPFNT